MKTIRRTLLPRVSLGTWAWLTLLFSSACQRQVGTANSLPPAGVSPTSCLAIDSGPPPAWPAAPALKPVASSLFLEVDAPMALLQREFDRYIPRRLASEKDRPIGAAGRVTFDVRRGPISLQTTNEKLIARVPTTIEMSICKPLGSICLTYGRCQPEYEISASVNRELIRAGELAPVELHERVSKGCRVAIDVTPMITKVVQDQLRTVERRIDREVPSLTNLLKEQLPRLAEPMRLGPNYCLAVAPRTLMPTRPRVKDEVFRVGAGASFSLMPVACDAHLAQPPMPEVAPAPAKAKNRIYLPELVTIEDLQHALNDKLARKQPGQPLQAKAEAVIPGKEGLLLRLRLSGSHCGLVHLSVRPHWDESGLVLKPSLLSESGLDEVVRQALVEKLRGPLPVALPSGDIIEGLPLLVDTSLAIAGRMSELEALALDADVVLPSLQERRAGVVAEGVVVTQVLAGPLRLRLKAAE